jgi:hypothetical protein
LESVEEKHKYNTGHPHRIAKAFPRLDPLCRESWILEIKVEHFFPGVLERFPEGVSNSNWKKGTFQDPWLSHGRFLARPLVEWVGCFTLGCHICCKYVEHSLAT